MELTRLYSVYAHTAKGSSSSPYFHRRIDLSSASAFLWCGMLSGILRSTERRPQCGQANRMPQWEDAHVQILFQRNHEVWCRQAMQTILSPWTCQKVALSTSYRNSWARTALLDSSHSLIPLMIPWGGFLYTVYTKDWTRITFQRTPIQSLCPCCT